MRLPMWLGTLLWNAPLLAHRLLGMLFGLLVVKHVNDQTHVVERYTLIHVNEYSRSV